MKILVASSATNYDESADPVAAVASFPWPAGSEFHVLTVAEIIEPIMVGMVPEAFDVTDAQLSFEAEARSTAARSALRLRNQGFRVEGIALEGNPEKVITDYAKHWGADLIVVGSRDHSLLERLFLGSVSEGVMKHSPCSVLVVKHRATA